jgi:uncharacterized protein
LKPSFVKKLFSIPLLLLISFFSRGQAITGSWYGTLIAGVQKLKVVFHIKYDSAHVLQSTFDSPDQHAFGISCSETGIKNDSLEIMIKQINGGYRGKWDGNNNITGYYFQNGMRFPTDLSRTQDTVAALVRPQTPKPPFPYNNEDLEYDNTATGIHYSGTLTYPKSGGPFPAAILITGSGQQDRDETLFGHKPFAVIADYLTRRGYAVLRVDDRQIGKSTGDLIKATSMDFAGDVEVSLHELQKRNDINQKKIGLIGHSEGGLIAPMVASENPGIDFIILLAGPGLKGTELLALQREAVARSDNVNLDVSQATNKLSNDLIQAVLNSRDTSIQMQEIWNSYLSWKKNMDPAVLSSMGLSDETNARNFLRAQEQMLNKPWLLYFLQTDPATFLVKLKCKVLALNGSKDIQVVPDPNLAAIDGALKKSQVKIYSIQKLPGLNHLFQHCKTCTVQEYAELEETFAPEVLKIMGEWLDKNVK